VADQKQAKRLAPDERRSHLVEVAVELFAQNGYSGTDLNDVAEAAGIQRPLLYHYFGGKEPLFVAALEAAWGNLASRMTIDPARGPGLLEGNLGTFLDLVEEGDQSAELVRQARRLDLEVVEETTRNATRAIASNMALNQLGLENPPDEVLSVLQAFMAFFETLIDEWSRGVLNRAQVETVVAATLPGIAVAARDAAAL
jgi:AcrR family transcriptional regulator